MDKYKKISWEFFTSYLLQGLSVLLGFLAFPIITRYLTVKEYGFYSVLIVTFTLIISSIDFGLKNFIQRDLTSKSEKYKLNKMSIFNTFFLITSGIYILLFVIFQIINYIFLSIDMYLVTYFFFSMIFANYFGIFSFYLTSRIELIKSKILNFLNADLWLIILIVFIIFSSKLTIKSIFIIKLLASVLSLIFIILIIKNKNKIFTFKFNKKYLVKALEYSFPFVPMLISQWVITASDRYLIKIFSNNTQLGYYSYIYTLVAFISITGKQISSILLTYIIEAKNKKDHAKSNFLFNANLKYSLMIVIPGILGLLILRKEIVILLSGTKYLPALYVLPILLFYPLFRIININFQSILMIQNKTKLISKIYIVGMVLNIILNFVLVPFYGILGASIATITTYFLMTIMFYSISKKYFKPFYRFNFKFLRIERIIFSSLLMAAVLFFIEPTTPIAKISTIFFGAGIYFFLLLITGFFIKDELSLIKNLIKSPFY